MTDDLPPTPLPPAAQSPYPAHPAPHRPAAASKEDSSPRTSDVDGTGKASLVTLALAGAGAAAALGLIWSFARKPTTPAKKVAKDRKPGKKPRAKTAKVKPEHV